MCLFAANEKRPLTGSGGARSRCQWAQIASRLVMTS